MNEGRTRYRIQSGAPISGPLWPVGAPALMVDDRCAAIALAVKSHVPAGACIEVVEIESGDVVFSKAVTSTHWPDNYAA